MSKYYFELTLKPDNNNYELFLDLLTSITEDAIEELDGTLIVRSEEELDDLIFGMNEFITALNAKCEIIYEKKENIDWIKPKQSRGCGEAGRLAPCPFKSARAIAAIKLPRRRGDSGNTSIYRYGAIRAGRLFSRC